MKAYSSFRIIGDAEGMAEARNTLIEESHRLDYCRFLYLTLPGEKDVEGAEALVNKLLAESGSKITEESSKEDFFIMYGLAVSMCSEETKQNVRERAIELFGNGCFDYFKKKKDKVGLKDLGEYCTRIGEFENAYNAYAAAGLHNGELAPIRRILIRDNKIRARKFFRQNRDRKGLEMLEMA